jgi:recombination protein RecA
VVKNKLAPPFQITEFDIRYGTGIDAIGDLLDKAVEREVIKKNGSYYSFESTSLGQGRERARESLLADANVRDLVRQKLSALPAAAVKGAPEPVDAAA